MIVRTVFQPGEDLEVTAEDAEVLRLQGLLCVPAELPEPEPAAVEPEPEPAAAPAAKPDPPAATSAPADQAPPTQKG